MADGGRMRFHNEFTIKWLQNTLCLPHPSKHRSGTPYVATVWSSISYKTRCARPFHSQKNTPKDGWELSCLFNIYKPKQGWLLIKFTNLAFLLIRAQLLRKSRRVRDWHLASALAFQLASGFGHINGHICGCSLALVTQATMSADVWRVWIYVWRGEFLALWTSLFYIIYRVLIGYVNYRCLKGRKIYPSNRIPCPSNIRGNFGVRFVSCLPPFLRWEWVWLYVLR